VTESLKAESAGKPGFTRRRFIIGSAGVGAIAALGGTAVRAPRALAATAPTGPPTSTLPLPTTTEPEQLLLTWGANPATQVTVSWSAPGTVAQPAPTLAWSTRPITDANPGHLIKLPDPSPLDVSRRYDEASSVSFTDDLNGQTTYFYHVQLSDLWPATRYYYKVSDGAATPSTAGASLTTAPSGRAKYRFSSFGDLATPPNRQTIWLEKTLAEARRDRSVDMIVVFMHQCAMSTSVPGNGSDLGIRQAWLPLFDKYEVDLVLSGHEHDYERTYPVRGYDAGDLGTVVAPNPGQTAYGYSIFDVDPGSGPGDTTVTLQYFAIPAVSNEAGTAHDGTTTLPTTPTEKFVFGRKVGRR
jgi:Purple acid Phosphatase, N-terminal domain